MIENATISVSLSLENASTEHDAMKAGSMGLLNWNILLLVPIIVLVAMGNVLVIVSVIVEQNLRSPTNCFLSSLAVADLLVALTVMPPSVAMIVNNYDWPFSDQFCGVWVMLDVLFSTSSILHLCMLSFDRYMALARPFQISRLNSATTPNSNLGILTMNKPKVLKRVARKIFCVWAIAIGIAVPIPIMQSLNRSDFFQNNMCVLHKPQFQVFGSVAAFFVPLVLMFVMYTLTIKTLRKQARMVSGLMVYNGKSLLSNGRDKCRKPLKRYNSAKIANQNFLKRTCLGQNFQRKTPAGNLTDNDDFSNVSFKTLDTAREAECSVCHPQPASRPNHVNHRLATFGIARERTQRIKELLCFERKENNGCNKKNMRDRCTCIFEKNVTENSEIFDPVEKQKFQRSYRSSVRRISSSFKNKAMTSITTEQRASKVLGLIFVLFCVSWCPFFITNVLSGLCTDCNQELLGELMNWFVWIGYVSSGVNPCVYTLFSRRFRRTFLLLLCCKWSHFKRRKHRVTFSKLGSSGTSIHSNGWNPQKISGPSVTSPLRETMESYSSSAMLRSQMYNDRNLMNKQKFSSNESGDEKQNKHLWKTLREPTHPNRISARDFQHFHKHSRYYQERSLSYKHQKYLVSSFFHHSFLGSSEESHGSTGDFVSQNYYSQNIITTKPLNGDCPSRSDSSWCSYQTQTPVSSESFCNDSFSIDKDLRKNSKLDKRQKSLKGYSLPMVPTENEPLLNFQLCSLQFKTPIVRRRSF